MNDIEEEAKMTIANLLLEDLKEVDEEIDEYDEDYPMDNEVKYFKNMWFMSSFFSQDFFNLAENAINQNRKSLTFNRVVFYFSMVLKTIFPSLMYFLCV